MQELGRSFPSPIIASLIIVEAVLVTATVRRASTKILMHRNYPNYHVNGILRVPCCVFARSRLLATVIYAHRVQPADRRVRLRGSWYSRFVEIYTYASFARIHVTARATQMHESNCFISRFSRF